MLRRTAIAGGTLAWVVPSIQVVSMSRAAADTPSGMPEDHGKPPGGHGGHVGHVGHGTGGAVPAGGGGTGVGGETTSTHLTGSTSADVAAGQLAGVSQSVPLASTGASGLTTAAGVVGGALTVAGAASVVAARRRAANATASDAPDAQTEQPD